MDIRLAKDLSRNPLGIVALFIVLVYGIAALTMGLTSSLTAEERLPFICFLVIFPVLVLIVFYNLVSRHHEKLYAPADYTSDEAFLSAAQIRSRHLTELQTQQEQMIETVRKTIEKSVSDASEVKSVIADVQSEIKKATTIAVDTRTFLGRSGQINFFPIGAFDTIDALMNEVYFLLEPKVKPFEYGHSWVLKNNGEVIKTSRIITETPAGRPIADNRALSEVNINPGDVLVVEKP